MKTINVMKTIGGVFSPRPPARAGRITNGMRGIALALAAGVAIAALAAAPLPAQAQTPIPETPELTTVIIDGIDGNYVRCGSVHPDQIDGICSSPFLIVPEVDGSTELSPVVTVCTEGDSDPCEAIFTDPENPLPLTYAPATTAFAYTGTESCVNIYQYIFGTMYVFQVCSEAIVSGSE